MIYLESFHIPSRNADEAFFNVPAWLLIQKNSRTCYTAKYPFAFFRKHELLESFEFRGITVFSGNKGNGQGTILNITSERL